MRTYTEEDYPFLVSEVMKYIELIKTKEKDTSLIDIIYDFCFKNSIEIELVGDAISNDVYFKSFIEKDCQLHRYFKTEAQTLDEW